MYRRFLERLRVVIKSKTFIVIAIFFAFLLISVSSFLYQKDFLQKKCSSFKDIEKQICFKEMIDRALSKNDFNRAFDLLLLLSQEDKNFADSCHANSHTIGKNAYKYYSQGNVFTYTPKMSYCAFGFFHGFIEALFAETGKIDEVADFCFELEKMSKTRGIQYSCFHGLGHGSVDGTTPEHWGDPKKIIIPGIEVCSHLPKHPEIQYTCIAGAYNSLEILSSDPRYGLDSLIEDPFAFCNSEPREQAEACYINMLPLILRNTKDNTLEASSYGLNNMKYGSDNSVNSEDLETSYIVSLYAEFIRLNLSNKEKVVLGIDECRNLQTKKLQDACVEGLSFGIIKYYPPNTAIGEWFLLCGNSYLTEQEKDTCHNYVLERLPAWYTDNESRQICNSAPEKYRNACTRRTETSLPIIQ